jgi:hypothetical protein
MKRYTGIGGEVGRVLIGDGAHKRRPKAVPHQRQRKHYNGRSGCAHAGLGHLLRNGEHRRIVEKVEYESSKEKYTSHQIRGLEERHEIARDSQNHPGSRKPRDHARMPGLQPIDQIAAAKNSARDAKSVKDAETEGRLPDVQLVLAHRIGNEEVGHRSAKYGNQRSSPDHVPV